MSDSRQLIRVGQGGATLSVGIGDGFLDIDGNLAGPASDTYSKSLAVGETLGAGLGDGTLKIAGSITRYDAVTIGQQRDFGRADSVDGWRKRGRSQEDGGNEQYGQTVPERFHGECRGLTAEVRV